MVIRVVLKRIEKFISIHGNTYDYSKVKYDGMHKKVCIICPKHGEFWQTPANHLKNHGCEANFPRRSIRQDLQMH